jgi:hypothetical protein
LRLNLPARRGPDDTNRSVEIAGHGNCRSCLNPPFHSDDDRAALINMQRHRAITEIVLQETMRTSLQLIWREEIQPRAHSAARSVNPGN